MAETRLRLGSYVDMWTAPDLQGLAWAACSDRLRSYVRPIFGSCDHWPKMGFADSEVQTRERHFLPVNRAEYLTYVDMWTAPDLQGLAGAGDRIACAHMSGLSIGSATLAKMGFANSEIQTRERHLLPVNRAESPTCSACADHTTSSYSCKFRP